MRHQLKNKKLKGDKKNREKVLANLACSLLLYEKIRTTKTKAKKVKAVVDRAISQKKKENLASQRRLEAVFFKKNAVKKIKELRKHYKDRKSGFVRMAQVGYRKGDGAPIVVLELILPEKIEKEKKIKEKKSKIAKPKVTVVEKGKKIETKPKPPASKKEISIDEKEKRKRRTKEIRKKGAFERFKDIGKKIIGRRTTSK